MSHGPRIIAFVVVIALIVAGLWYGKNYNPKTSAPEQKTTVVQEKNETQSASVSSNTTVDEDLVGLGTEFKALDADSASIDAGLNDKPVSQAE